MINFLDEEWRATYRYCVYQLRREHCSRFQKVIPQIGKGREKVPKPKCDHKTKLGRYYIGDSSSLLRDFLGKELDGRVQLLFTSPPYPLNEKKSYGNLKAEEYKRWSIELAETFAGLLTPSGSIVIEIGNAWEAGRPVQSLLSLESLIGFVSLLSHL